MATPTQVARFGPFNGGLNNKQDITSIADTELSECVNWEIDTDGVLVNRPIITANTGTENYNVGTGGNGIFADQDDGYAVIPIIVARYKNDGAALLYKQIHGGVRWERMNQAAYSINGSDGSYIPNVNKGTFSSGTRLSAVQFSGNLYFINNTTPSKGFKVPIGERATNATFITSMPQGETLINHKGRLFAFPGPTTTSAENDRNSTFYYTDAPYTGGAWPTSTNFVNVGYGDGQYITGAAVYNGDIVIFKENSTWRFSYESNISGASLDVLNPNVGSMSSESFTTCNGVLYTFHEGDVHEVYNFQWTNTSENIEFKKKSGGNFVYGGVHLYSLGDRVILSYYGSLYCYSQKSRVWVEWETDFPLGRGITVNSSVLDVFDKEMLLASHARNTPGTPADFQTNYKIYQLYRMFDTNDSVLDIDKYGSADTPVGQTNSESFECRLTTKGYDFGADFALKRLMWWGATVLTTEDVLGKATIIVNRASYTWDDLSERTWDMLDQATWDDLIDVLPTAVSDVKSSNYLSHGRRFIKFLRGLRFRQLFFFYKVKVDGTADTIPTKFFGITAMYKGKGDPSSQIS